MQKVVRIVFLILVVSFIVSCGNSNNPKDVAMKFTKYIVNEEYEKAAELGTSDTKQMINFMAMMAGDGEKSSGKSPKIKHVSTKIDGDNAVVVLSSAGEEQEISLVKIDGKWLVQMEKDNTDMDKDSSFDFDAMEPW